MERTEQMTDENVQAEIQEEIRIRAINNRAYEHLNNLLAQLNKETIDGDELLASMYAHMIAAYICGYAPHVTVEDARTAAEKIIAMCEGTESQTNQSETV
jgi:hypothetical protein